LSLLRRLLVGFTTILVVTIVPYASAGAIALEPTNWQSQLISVDPPTEGVRLEVLGGDTAIRVSAKPGVSVIIRGYQDEPYLRIDEDGTVWENNRAPSTALNRSRFGASATDLNADANAEPEWVKIGASGAAVWHDHRVHPMPGVSSDLDWRIVLTVDETTVNFDGKLAKLPSHNPVAEIAIGVLTLIGVIIVSRRTPLRSAAVTALVAAGLALVISVGEWVATPSGLSHRWLPTLLAAGAAALGVAAVALFHRPNTTLRLSLLMASIALSAGWVIIQFPSITAAIVPGPFAMPLTRFAIAITAGLVVGAAGTAVMSGGLSTDPERATVRSG